MIAMTDRPGTNAEYLFGELAVRLFLLTRKDLDRGLRAQREAREAGGDPSLGEVLVGLSLLTEEQVATILRAQAIYDDKSVETLYGRIAIKNGFLTQSNLDSALKTHERLQRRLRIGEVLVKKGYLTWEQHEAILRAQERILNGIERAGRDGEPADAPAAAPQRPRPGTPLRPPPSPR